MSRVRPAVKRQYDASRRREAAARTREAILNAALALFGERGYAATPMTAIAGALAPVRGILQRTAPAEPELAALWLEIAERRAANMHRFVADLAAVAELRVDPGIAADIVWATNAPELYELLVSQRGWTPERYEHFLADTWQRLLLAG